MSQATTACDSWINAVKRLAKEVAEQSTERIAGNTSSYFSSVPLPPPGIDHFQPFTPTEHVDSPLQTSRPAEGNPWELQTEAMKDTLEKPKRSRNT